MNWGQVDMIFHYRRGHRRYSFVASDVNELQEIRARQRTFHGAYNRTALGTLGYAVVILRLFDSRFHKSKVIVIFQNYYIIENFSYARLSWAFVRHYVSLLVHDRLLAVSPFYA